MNEIEPFFSIWRNKYLNNQVFNHIYIMRALTRKPKQNLAVENYYIKCKYQNYKENQYNHYISKLIISDRKYNELGEYYISETVTSLMLYYFRDYIEKLNEIISTTSGINVTNLSLNSYEIPELNIYTIPSQIKILNLNRFYGDLINNNNHRQSNLTELNISNFDNQIKIGDIPNSVKKLYLGNKFNKPLELDNVCCLPNSIIQLELGQDFTQPLTINSLPSNLVILKFNISWNKKLQVGVLPKTLKHLTFGSFFNSPLPPGVLPDALESLVLGQYWDLDPTIENLAIPSSLTSLIFGYSFGTSSRMKIGILIDNPTPPFNYPQFSTNNTIRKLEFQSLYHSPFQPGSFPSSITDLKVNWNDYQEEYTNLYPTQLQSLTVQFNVLSNQSGGTMFSQLPTSCTNLTITGLFGSTLSNISNSITSLTIFTCEPYTQEVIHLPNSLTYLKTNFSSKFNENVFTQSAKSLKTLKLACTTYQHSIPSLPLSLESFSFSSEFKFQKFQNLSSLPNLIKLRLTTITITNDIPVGYLPRNSIKTLVFPMLNNSTPIQVGMIPESVEKLKISCGISVENGLQVNSIPSSVTCLSISPCDSNDQDQNSFENIIPTSIKILKLSSKFNRELKENELPINGNLESISIKNEDYSFPLTTKNIPSTVLKLKLPCSIDKTIIDPILKRNLIIIKK